MAARFGYFVATALAFGGLARGADTLESVEKKIIAQAEKTKTWSAKMTSSTDMDGPSMKMKSKMTGTYECARRGDKTFSRMECKSTSTTKVADQPEMKTDTTVLAILDGEFAYSLTESNGQRMAVKTKPDLSKGAGAAKAMFEQMHKDHDLKLLPDEKVDGKEVYVIEATPKQPQPDTTTRLRFYYLKDSGIAVRSVSETKDKSNKASTTTQFTDIKLNPDIKPDRFVFKAPEGVEVMDMTKALPPDAVPAGGATEEKAAPETEKKAEPQPAPTTAEPQKKTKKPGLPLPRLKNPLK